MDSNTTQQPVSPGALPGLIFASLAALVCGLLLPSVSGVGSRGFLEAAPGPAMQLILLVGIPMVVGAIGCVRSPILAGLAGGAAMFLGLAIGFVWIFVFVLIFSYDGLGHIGPGSFFLLVCSVLSVTAALYSQRFRRVDAVANQSPSPISVLGVIATLLTVVGAFIPTNRVELGQWLGFSSTSILPGLVSLAFLAGLVYVGIAGFLGGRWGLGLVGGFVGVIAVGAVMTNTQSELSGFFVGNRAGWHPLATVGFWAMVALLLAHLVEVLGATPALAPLPVRVATPVSAATPNTPPPLPPAVAERRTCPFCAEQIKAAAIVCRFCGRDITPLANATIEVPAAPLIAEAIRREYPGVSDQVWASVAKFSVVEQIEAPTLQRVGQLVAEGWTPDDAVSTCFLGIRHTEDWSKSASSS